MIGPAMVVFRPFWVYTSEQGGITKVIQYHEYRGAAWRLPVGGCCWVSLRQSSKRPNMQKERGSGNDKIKKNPDWVLFDRVHGVDRDDASKGTTSLPHRARHGRHCRNRPGRGDAAGDPEGQNAGDDRSALCFG